MTDPLNMPEPLLDLLTRPSVQQLAQHHPGCTYVHTIPWSDWFAMEQRIEQALRRDGLPDIDDIEFSIWAMEVFERRVHKVARDWDITDYRVASGPNENGDLAITIVSASVKGAMLLKMALAR